MRSINGDATAGEHVDDDDLNSPEAPPADLDVPPAPAKGRRRLRKILIRSLVAFVVLAALCLVGGTYYYDSVALPDDLRLNRATTIYYADGTTPLARIGEQNRTLVTIGQIPPHVQHAVVAAEDPSFYSNRGVDYGDAAGAAWNHVFGDGSQGAATISQQYARQWADLEGVTYSRKLRESVIALKLNDQYSKDQILALYLNIVYFGRGAYGIEAAAQAYFDKPVSDLTLAEGIVLAGLIKSPEGNDGKGSPFDPSVDATRAHERFDYIKQQMVALDYLTPADAEQKAVYPTRVLTAAQARARAATVYGGMDKPGGLIVHHVLGEVAALIDPATGKPVYEDTDRDGAKHFDRIRNDGLKVVTTIDPTMQQVAIREASRTAESNMDKQPANLQAALVAVEPGTGEVKAYYGGDSGNGNDYAGSYRDPVLGNGQDSCCGGHPAGATFNVYTMATGLIDGYSTDSHWNGESPQDFPASGRAIKNNNPVRNLGEGNLASPPCASGSAKWCTLDESAVLSLNVPFFALAEKAGPDKVIDTARAAGIGTMWATVNGTAQKVDLTTTTGRDVFPKYFGPEVALGQYPVTVLDQAGGMATFAARGAAARTHFLKEIWTDGRKTYAAPVRPVRIPGFTEAMAADLSAALQGVPQHYNLTPHDGRQVAGATGTWQLGPTSDTGHAWMVGYTASDPGHDAPGLAVAVWVGNKGPEQKIVDKDGHAIIGGSLPGQIWRDFLDGALTETNAPKATFPAKVGTGDKKIGTGVQP
ncbi:transglycosylase domain-containing protein [Dactylosporangium sp. CA-139066]|uniref:transglycosylase domain-containing protein n=1 Tax=Dactylosporangium sp. CA-139066 TaxID=3239930 RepID=UPI003D905408